MIGEMMKDDCLLPFDECGCLAAAMMYVLRRDPLIHPQVNWDDSGLPHVSGEDKMCLGKVRSPAKSHPYSEMNSARTLSHCCRRFYVPKQEIPEARRFVAVLDNMFGDRPRKKYAEPYEQVIRSLVNDKDL